jgi:hypothetical protein
VACHRHIFMFVKPITIESRMHEELEELSSVREVGRCLDGPLETNAVMLLPAVRVVCKELCRRAAI